MEEQGVQGPCDPADPSSWKARIKAVRAAFQCLGALVCVLFAVQGVAVFTDTSGIQDFWQACHWVAEGVLYIIIGVGGCFLEVRALFASVRQHFARFAVNRLALALVYLWVGCYSMGGRIQARDGWATLGKITGVIAWLVGMGDLLTSCCSDRSERSQNALQTPAACPSQQASGSPLDRPGSRYSCTTAPTATAPDDSPGSDGDNPFVVETDADAKNPFAEEMPPGGWATVGTKPFGAS